VRGDGSKVREGFVDKTIKVTDKRMFTPEGALREEYRFLAEAANAPAAPPVAAPEPEPEPVAPPEVSSPALELPPTGLPGPGFFDLLQALAEPIPFYLGDAPMPDGASGENLEAARFYIDLLDVLRQKTAGNLSAQETTVLADLVYRLRVRYVQKRG
jgi:Domain of unknown function (DUF1844)